MINCSAGYNLPSYFTAISLTVRSSPFTLVAILNSGATLKLGNVLLFVCNSRKQRPAKSPSIHLDDDNPTLFRSFNVYCAL